MAGINYRFRLVGAERLKSLSKYLQKEFAKTLNVNVQRAAWHTNEAIRDDLGALTSTWNHKVYFRVWLSHASTSSVTISISTNDAPFNFLEGGTGIRYATMTSPFSPKTRVGSLASSAGVGSLHYINRERPRPGIEARGFYPVLVEKHRPDYITRMRQAYIAALRRVRLR